MSTAVRPRLSPQGTCRPLMGPWDKDPDQGFLGEILALWRGEGCEVSQLGRSTEVV